MELHHFLRSRRSVRRFTQDEVPDEVIRRIVETACYAPSAHNRQPWRFCVLKQAGAKARLAEAMAVEFRNDLLRDGLPDEEVDKRIEQSRSRINSSPVVIVLCMDMSEMDVYPDERRAGAERMMAIQSTAAAGSAIAPGSACRGSVRRLDLRPVVCTRSSAPGFVVWMHPGSLRPCSSSATPIKPHGPKP